jgi:hypothetical protein
MLDRNTRFFSFVYFPRVFEQVSKYTNSSFLKDQNKRNQEQGTKRNKNKIMVRYVGVGFPKSHTNQGTRRTLIKNDNKIKSIEEVSRYTNCSLL